MSVTSLVHDDPPGIGPDGTRLDRFCPSIEFDIVLAPREDHS